MANLTSAQIQFTFAATVADAEPITTITARTSKRDSFTYSEGNGTAEAMGVVDVNVTIAANSTVVTFSNLTDTASESFSYTELKAFRIHNPSGNGNVTVASSISGLPTGTMPPNTTWGVATGDATGYACDGTSNVTVGGVTNETVTLTMLLS